MALNLYKYFAVEAQGAEEGPPPTKRAKTREGEGGSDESDDEEEEQLATQTAESISTDASTTSSMPGPSRQATTFLKRWLKGRHHWLENVDGQGMLCKLCRKYDKHSYGHDTWNKTPCTRMRLQSITTHELSAAHKDSVRLELALSQSQSIVSTLNPPVPKKGIYQAFKCLYFLTKQRIPHTTNYEPLLDLLESLGLTVKSDICIAKNATYTSDKTIQEMVNILSEVLETNTINQTRESNHIALMFDETTDCTVTEQLALHGRFIDKATGNLKSCYLKIIDVLKPEVGAASDSEQDICISVNASTITKRVKEFIAEADLDPTKIRGIGTDGAATMIGCRNGVVRA